MAGTTHGGKKTSETNKEKYGADYYKRIGAIGGRNGTTGGFYGDPERAKLAGLKGGRPRKAHAI